MHDESHSAGLLAESPASVSSAWRMPVRHRKVAILGFAETVKDCPWRDPSWELWGMNGFWRAAKPDFEIDVPEERYSLWFDMHTLEFTTEYGKAARIPGQQEEWLAKPHPFTILMLDEQHGFPSAQRYPFEGVIGKLGRDYFTSSIAYALAYALAQDDIAEIGLWGIDLVHGTEYEQQRPCAEYWIGRAEAVGIKVTVHERSALLNNRGQRYGLEPPNELLRDLRKILGEQAAGLERAINDHKNKVEELTGRLHTDDGARQAVLGVLSRLDVYERGGRI